MTQYLLAKKFKGVGCIALDTSVLDSVTNFRNALDLAYYGKGIQFIVISRPIAYPEYKPYTFVKTEIEFREAVSKLKNEPDTL